MTATERLRTALGRPVDPSGLGAFRVLFGALALYTTVRFVLRGWVSQLFIEPNFHFTYLGFEWVRPWPALGMYAHFVVMGLAAACLTLGVLTRASACVFFLSFSYAELIEKASYLNHYYLMSLIALLLAALPCQRAFSLDKSQESPPSVSASAYWLLRTQIGLVYVFAGAAKLNSDWLLRAEPLRTWLPAHAQLPLLGPLFSEPATAFALSWAGALYDLLIPFLLLVRRTRALAFVLVVVFHVATYLLFPIGVFPWLMIATATLFFDPAWPRAVLARVKLRQFFVTPVNRAPPERTSPLKLSEPGAILALAYLSLQLLLPLRFLAYPGEVNWTEQGFRFAWRVLLIEKTGQVDYDVFADGARHFRVHPRSELGALQYRMLSTQPDMIHEYALHLRDRYTRLGNANVRVHANAWASLNGRPSQRLIDPNRDLGDIPRSLGHQSFIVPLEHVEHAFAARGR